MIQALYWSQWGFGQRMHRVLLAEFAVNFCRRQASANLQIAGGAKAEVGRSRHDGQPTSTTACRSSCPAEEMAAYPVSKHVNKPANDDPACCEPLKKLRIVRPGPPDDPGPGSPEQESLF